MLQGLSDHADLLAHSEVEDSSLSLFLLVSLGFVVPFKPLTVDSGQRVNELRCMELKGNETD